MKEVYTVVMYRYGTLDAHNYLLGVFDKKQAAINAGEEERKNRGNKYLPNVTKCGLNGKPASHKNYAGYEIQEGSRQIVKSRKVKHEDVGMSFLNNKTKDEYFLRGYSTNTTNDQDGQEMVEYENVEGKSFVREKSEFYSKFTRTRQDI